VLRLAHPATASLSLLRACLINQSINQSIDLSFSPMSSPSPGNFMPPTKRAAAAAPTAAAENLQLAAAAISNTGDPAAPPPPSSAVAGAAAASAAVGGAPVTVGGDSHAMGEATRGGKASEEAAAAAAGSAAGTGSTAEAETETETATNAAEAEAATPPKKQRRDNADPSAQAQAQAQRAALEQSAAQRAALEHVLVDVCGFTEASSAILRDFRRGGFNCIDDLCNLTDKQVSALVHRNVSHQGEEDAAFNGASNTESAREVQIRDIELLKMWRANWFQERSTKPTSEDWLRLTKDGLDEFHLGTTLKSPPASPAASAAANFSPEVVAAAERKAHAFVESIMGQDPKPIPESDGMLVMRGVVKLETGVRSDVVIRKLTQPFWQACIDTVDLPPPPSDYQQDDSPNRQIRVCAVGTPGIGKTTCTPFLIRMLLKDKKTVVYHVRAPKEAGWIYEFIPGSSDGGPVTANAYPEQAFRSGVPSLNDTATYYVVDPGDTDDTCNPHRLFSPKVIIVASPDSKHWGANYFYKDRDGAPGVLKVFPVWELQELHEARQVLGRTMTAQQVSGRYYQVGGVPRHVFGSDMIFNEALAKQAEKTDSLNCEQAERIAIPKLQRLTTLDASQPQSALIGFRAYQESGFSKYTIDVIAPRVGERLFRRLLMDMWDKLLLPGVANPWVLEAYTRYLLGTNRTLTFQRRRGVGKSHRQRHSAQSVSLGGCGEIRSTWDVVAAAMDRPMVVYHPVHPAQRLIDFIYQDSEGHFHAFQVTLAEKHSADVNHILELERQVGDPGRLSLYYMVPEFRFAAFVTHPVDPRNPRRGHPRATCDIYHVAIPDPQSMEDVESF
jgi:hypothetical protein